MPILNQQRFVLGSIGIAAALGATLGTFRLLSPPNSGIRSVETDDFTLEFRKRRPLTAERHNRISDYSDKSISGTSGGDSSLDQTPDNASKSNSGLAANHVSNLEGQSHEDRNNYEDSDVARAIDLIDNGKIEAATAALEQILAKNPRNEQALIELGMIQLIDNHKPDAALPLLKTALQINPNNRMVASEIVGIYEDRGDRDDGLSFLKDLYGAHPDADGLAVGIGQILIGQGKDFEAVPFLETAARTSPDPAFHYAELGDIYGRMGDHDRAAKSYDSAINKEVENLSRASDAGSAAVINERIDNLRKDKASSLIDSGDIDGAEEILRKFTSPNQNDASVQALWKKIAIRRG